jgi:hypothetical protein
MPYFGGCSGNVLPLGAFLRAREWAFPQSVVTTLEGLALMILLRTSALRRLPGAQVIVESVLMNWSGSCIRDTTLFVLRSSTTKHKLLKGCLRAYPFLTTQRSSE